MVPSFSSYFSSASSLRSGHRPEDVRHGERARSDTDNRSTAGGWPHHAACSGFSAHAFSDLINQYLGRRAGSRAASSAHHHDPEEAGASLLNTLLRMFRSMRSELDGLRQSFQEMGGNAGTQGRPVNTPVTEEQLRQEAEDLELAKRMQKLEDQHEKAALDREMSQAIAGFEVAKNGYKAVESISR